MKKIVAGLFSLFVLVAALPLRAEVVLNPLFTDGAVLQQGIEVPVWGTAADGEKVTVSLAGQTVSTVAKDGRWIVRLKPLKSGGAPLTLTVKGNNTVTVNGILVGEVWVCSGQSNMQWTLENSATGKADAEKSADDLLRLFYVPRVTSDTPLATVSAKWEKCEAKTALPFSAVAYYFGRDLRKALGVPVGLIHTSWGGTPAEAWTSREVLEADPMLKEILSRHADALAKFDAAKAEENFRKAAAKHKEAVAKAKAEGKPAPAAPRRPENPAASSKRPCALYNAMINPLLPYAIKGAIWYQGESNAGRAKEYQTLFPAMIRNWRDVWGQGDFPFLFVQIAPYNGQPPEIREAQLISWQKTKNTSMVVITDHGEANDIHPKAKEPVGARLALAARALAYGEKLVYSGPVYQAMKVEGGKAVLRFTHVGGGLVAKGGALKGFTIAGADKKFAPAEAVISGDTVVVSSPQVAAPAAVRYGWANVPDVNLFNREGLPASPFRTDPE